MRLKKEGDFQTRVPKKDCFTEYIYSFVDGTKTVISRNGLNPDIDNALYEELKKEANNNEVQIEKHRAISRDPKKHDILLNLQSSEVNIEEDIIKKMSNDNLKKLIKNLEPQQQELIVKKFVLNLSNTEIAKKEKVSEGAIRNRLRKIYKKLRKSYKR